MAAFSCGMDALTLGSLMMLASGWTTSLPSSPSVSGTRCASVRLSGKAARMRAASEMSRVSMAIPAGAAKALRMGSREKVARAGASSVNV